MNKEKMLYHALHNGTLRLTQGEIVNGIAKSITELVDGGFLTWETHRLWSEYKTHEIEHMYDTATHEYKITKDGEVLLAIYRLEYAHKNHHNSDKHKSRVDELNHLWIESGKDWIHYHKSHLTKNQIKALKYAKELLGSDFGPTDSTPKPTETTSSVPSFEALELSNMFNLSVALGRCGANDKRTVTYVMDKCVEELGELSVEKQIAAGSSYKTAGADGIKGEAVDLAICAMDMFALQFPNMSADEIEREFLSYMTIKLEKWKKSLDW